MGRPHRHHARQGSQSPAEDIYYYVKLTNLPKPAKNGSALIVLKATADKGTTIADGDILWSWHLWFTDYAPDYNSSDDAIDSASISGTGVVTPVKNGVTHRYNGAAFGTSGSYPNGQGMMDRNLGSTYSAASTSISDMIDDHIDDGSAVSADNFNALRGMYYQFGRKDPFPHTGSGKVIINTITVKDGNGADFTFINGYVNGSTPSQRGETTSDLKYAVNNPDTFVSDYEVWHNPRFSYDWPAIFDPSPAGWSVAKASQEETSNVWWDFSDDGKVSKSLAFTNDDTTVAGWAGYLVSGTTDEGTAQWAYYPAAGMIDRAAGCFNLVGSSCVNFSQTSKSVTMGSGLYIIQTATYSETSHRRASALPVRCVKN